MVYNNQLKIFKEDLKIIWIIFGYVGSDWKRNVKKKFSFLLLFCSFICVHLWATN